MRSRCYLVQPHRHHDKCHINASDKILTLPRATQSCIFTTDHPPQLTGKKSCRSTGISSAFAPSVQDLPLSLISTFAAIGIDLLAYLAAGNYRSGGNGYSRQYWWCDQGQTHELESRECVTSLAHKRRYLRFKAAFPVH